jgi:hypothetical protein
MEMQNSKRKVNISCCGVFAGRPGNAHFYGEYGGAAELVGTLEASSCITVPTSQLFKSFILSLWDASNSSICYLVFRE